MVSSKAKTVAQYLKEVPKEQRDELKIVRKLIKDNLSKGFVETMNWGMISYEVPLKVYPDTYNGKPLMYIALAAQKNNISLYIMCFPLDELFKEELIKGFEKIGQKPNMGKSCIRFKQADKIPLKIIGKYIKKTTFKKYIQHYKEIKGK